MKRLVCILMIACSWINGWAQPQPFPIDKTFVPELEFLQREWNAEYFGIDPMSRKRFYIKRELKLYTDMSFENEVRGGVIVNDVCLDTLVLKSERGSYSYDKSLQKIDYCLDSDSVLSLNKYVSVESVIEYICNDYLSTGNNQTYSEATSFMAEENGNRPWVLQDTKMGSDVAQGMPAVYIMNGKDLKPTCVLPLDAVERSTKHSCFDLLGNRQVDTSSYKGILIMNGKKVLVK
ncbi:MAG: hypothetical protein ACI4D4_01910 [Lachnospira sp.]